MKRNTIKWRIFKYNFLVIICFLLFTTVIFNIAIRLYMEKDITQQLVKIATRTEDALLRKGPDYFGNPNDRTPPPLPLLNEKGKGSIKNEALKFDSPNNMASTTTAGIDTNNMVRFYFMLDRSLREPLSMLNADYVLIDNKENVLTPPQEFSTISDALMAKIKESFNSVKDTKVEEYINFSNDGSKYVGILKPVAEKNTFGLGWVLVYSSLDKVNQLQMGINIILFVILLLSGLVAALLSSLAAKRISQPFSTLNEHIGEIAERNFGNKLQVKVDDELREFVSNINLMSEKLEQHDKAQKTFLQNASHEFRTPLMSIQSYAEGIKYNVVESDAAAEVILDETKRMTNLVTDLLYLSRLEAIEESYCYNKIDVIELLQSCKTRTEGIANKNNIKIAINNCCQEKFNGMSENTIIVNADEEKLARAITNIIGNCIRYAKSQIEIKLEMLQLPTTEDGLSNKTNSNRVKIVISDDGPGFKEDELPNIFERFYKGTKGNFGLGLAITKNIIDKHNGTIIAHNSDSGAVFEIELPI